MICILVPILGGHLKSNKRSQRIIGRDDLSSLEHVSIFSNLLKFCQHGARGCVQQQAAVFDTNPLHAGSRPLATIGEHRGAFSRQRAS